MRQDRERGWHIELWKTEWVFWGYGPPGDNCGVVHVAPAVVVVDFGSNLGPTRCAKRWLEKASATSDLPAPAEYRRMHGVGWRVRTNNYLIDCGWHFTINEAAARVASRAFVERQMREHAGTYSMVDPADRIDTALADVRIRTS